MRSCSSVGGDPTNETSEPTQGQETADHARLIFQGLNADFYQAAPADYLSTRLNCLILVQAQDGRVDAVIKESPVTCGTVGVETLVDADDEETRAERTAAYVTKESQHLFTLAVETLLRLFIAHASKSPCPWLELSSLRAPGQFPKKLKKLEAYARDNPDAWVSLVAWVCFGFPIDRLETVPDAGPDLARSARHAARLIRGWAQRLLTDADLQNATKHGLAVVSGHSRMVISADGQEIVFGEGPHLEVLLKEWPSGFSGSHHPKQWKRGTAYVDPLANIEATQRVIVLIENLWAVASRRVGSVENDSIRLHGLDDEFTSADNIGGSLAWVRVPLGVWPAEEAPDGVRRWTSEGIDERSAEPA